MKALAGLLIIGGAVTISLLLTFPIDIKIIMSAFASGSWLTLGIMILLTKD